jgi:hypothetical protein
VSTEEPTPPTPSTSPITPAPPTSPTSPTSPTTPASAAEEPAASARPGGRARVGRLLGVAVLALAVLGGVGYTAVAVDGADRTAGAPSWKIPAKHDAKVPAATGLASLLVPYGTDDYERGPDLGEFGADAELSGARATALRKEALRGLPRTQRGKLEREIDKQHIKGMAMRSYLNNSYHDEVGTASITLVRMDRASVRTSVAGQGRLLDVLGDILRAGPRIEGHKDARCYLPPKDTGEKLDMMYCFARQGDVLVTATADGVSPMSTKGAAQLLKKQLDRIAEPGEAV